MTATSILAAAVAIAIVGAVWVVGEQRSQNAAAHLAAVVAATPDGGTVDLASAFPIAWDKAAVVGDYATGREVNDLLGVHVIDDDRWLSAEDSVLVFVTGDRVVAIIDVEGQPFNFGWPRDPDWRPLLISHSDARFTVHRPDGPTTIAELVHTGD